jgi:hypothetical protein
MSERAIERKHHVGRSTITKALASAEPPERKMHREPAALHGPHGHTDAMLKANPEIPTAAIWQQLADEHEVTVAHPALRAYVTSHPERKSSWQVLEYFRVHDLYLT